MVTLGEYFPEFSALSTHGEINFYDWIGDSWGMVFSYSADFNPVCTTELARLAKLYPQFYKRGCKVLGLSCDTVDTHNRWLTDVNLLGGCFKEGFPFPIIADEERRLGSIFQILDLQEKDADGIPVTGRAVFIIDSKTKVRFSLIYPSTCGRNFDEMLRVLDSLQLSDKHSVMTPVDWKQEEPVMIPHSVFDEEVQYRYPYLTTVALPSGRIYVRKAPQPQ